MPAAEPPQIKHRASDVSLWDRRHPRRSHVRDNAFEACVALAGSLTAIQFIADPTVRDAVAVGSIGSTFAWYWTILYLIGSTGIMMGLVSLQDRIELAGLCCFGPAALVNAVSLLQVRSNNSIYVALIFFAFAAGSLARIYTLLALRRVTPGARRNGG